MRPKQLVYGGRVAEGSKKSWAEEESAPTNRPPLWSGSLLRQSICLMGGSATPCGGDSFPSQKRNAGPRRNRHFRSLRSLQLPPGPPKEVAAPIGRGSFIWVGPPFDSSGNSQVGREGIEPPTKWL